MDEFKRRYFKELDKKRDAINIVIEKANEQHYYTTKDEKFNNAVTLKEFLEEKIQK
jgi:uncharacterized protein YeaO (DUF488 family)